RRGPSGTNDVGARVGLASRTRSFSRVSPLLTQPDPYPMSRAIVDERHGLLSRCLCAVDLHARNTAGDAIRILDVHLVARRVVTKRDGKAGPGARNAGIDEEGRAAKAKAQQPLDARAIHPAGRARVPAPSAAPQVGRLGVDVTRDDVRLDTVAVEPSARARVVDGVQDRDQLPRAIAVAERGECHDRPDRGVRVLATVLPDAGGVALEVTRIPRGAVERWGEEQDARLLPMHEIFFDRVHGARRAVGIGDTGKHSPRLRDRIDATLSVLGGSQRRAVAELRPPIPVAIPARGLERSSE